MMQLYLPGCQNLAYIVSSVKNKFLIIKKGKSTYFNKKELENWMLQIRVSTDEEVEQQAAQYVYNKN